MPQSYSTFFLFGLMPLVAFSLFKFLLFEKGSFVWRDSSFKKRKQFRRSVTQ